MTPAETKARIALGLKCLSDLHEHWDAVMVPVSIIVVDDDASFCELISEQIRMVITRKCEIKCVTTGHEAIELMNTTKVDIMFVDLRMPNATGSGLDVLREIDHKATVVLVVTGLMDDAPEVVEAKKLGHTLIIRKAELFEDLRIVFGNGCPFNPSCSTTGRP